MGAVDFLQTTSQLDAFDGVCELIVTFQEGNEALDKGRYVCGNAKPKGRWT